MRVSFLITICFSISVWASEFNTFKPAASFGSLSDKSGLDPNDVRNFSNIYGQIQENYKDSYGLIGSRLANESMSGIFGGVNMIGYRHSGEFSNFKVTFNRSIAPSLYRDNKYIVSDEVTIEIDASRFLKKLADDDVIDITERNLQAYAGLAFRRTMRFNHFSDTKAGGLQTHHDKLFMMYKYFQASSLNRLNPYDYLIKEDSFTVSAGGFATAPVLIYGSVGVGALYKYEKKSRITIQKLGEEDEKQPNEALRLSVEDSRITTAGAHAVLIADFFKILRLTLFSYDFEYTNELSNKTYLSLYEEDLSNPEKLDQLDGVLRYKPFDIDLFADNVTSKETRRKQIMRSKYTFLLFGGVKQSQSESVEIVKDGIIHKFFKHSYEKLKYKENFMSRIITSLLGKLIGYNQLAARTQVQQRLIDINYESKRNILKLREDYNIFDKNVFTMELSNKYKVSQSPKKSRRKSAKTIIQNEIRSKTNSYSKFSALINKNNIQSPSEFSAKYIMDNTNVEHFMKVSSDDVFRSFDSICKTKSRGIFKFFRSLFNGCKYRLYSSYNKFLKEWSSTNYSGGLYKVCSRKYRWRYIFRRSKKRRMIAKCMEIAGRSQQSMKLRKLPLWRFKDVVNHVNTNFNNVSDIHQLFGNFNNRGSVDVTIGNDLPYRGYYSEGIAKDNIINQFRNDHQLRSPASLK